MTQRRSTRLGRGLRTPHAESGVLDRLQRRLAESCGDLWDSFVDPREPYFDSDGGSWSALAGGSGGGSGGSAWPQSEDQLREIRNRCRQLAATNEFAINGHENRISYVVGTGHTYRATPHKSAPGSAAQLAADVQQVLDRFLIDNRWHHRQQEIVRRRDRDGEALLRFFVLPDGSTQLRFIEPDEVSTPVELRNDPAASFGMLTEPDDVETVRAYFIDGRPVDAAEIQHRRANVDDNVKRGLPLFYPVEKNLRRAEKLLRNMSTVAEIQAAIALIRKHTGGTASSVQQFVADSADATAGDRRSGQSRHFRRYEPGTILDAPAGLDYDFPAAGLDAGNFVTVLQAELRAVAARLVMPEFMLTSDASNANYASTLVAEGPAMRMFARLQAEMIVDDLAVMWRVVRNAVAAGTLSAKALSVVEIQASPPTLSVRHPRVDAEINQIEFQNGVLSPQTWCLRDGLDFDQEQSNLAAWRAKAASSSP